MSDTGTQRHLQSPNVSERETTEPPETSQKRMERLSVRVSRSGKKRIAARARAADILPSQMHRRMLRYADLHMPATWVPPNES